ncbi:MAG: hypothetical protein H7066_04640, partial [Cytophagaceae bacterium]|nr:hypothetical protein [Gemmatimonadaceae bacterium]
MTFGHRRRTFVTIPLQRALLLSLAAQLFAASLAAQAPRVREIGSASFGRREGIPAGPVLGMMLGRDGSLWVATQRGVRRYSGSGWTTDGVPAEVTTGLVRAVVDGGDGTRYFLRNNEVLQHRGVTLLHRVALPAGASPNYSAALTGALGTIPVLVIGGRDGLYEVSGSTVESVAPSGGL